MLILIYATNRCKYLAISHRRGIHESHATRFWLYDKQNEFHQSGLEEQVPLKGCLVPRMSSNKITLPLEGGMNMTKA